MIPDEITLNAEQSREFRKMFSECFEMKDDVLYLREQIVATQQRIYDREEEAAKVVVGQDADGRDIRAGSANGLDRALLELLKAKLELAEYIAKPK